MQWIEETRKRGNTMVQSNDLAKGLDEYMKCLVALDFSSCKGKKPTEDQVKMSEVAVKIPVLNNMALALNKQGHTQRALDMLE